MRSAQYYFYLINEADQATYTKSEADTGTGLTQKVDKLRIMICWIPSTEILSGPINGAISPTDERMCYITSASDVVLMSPPERNMDDVVELLCFTMLIL